VETPRGSTLVDPRIKRSNRDRGRIEHPAASAAYSTLASAKVTQFDVLDVWKVGYMVSNYPKAEWNRRKEVQGANIRNPKPASSQGRSLANALVQCNRNFKKP